MSDAIHTQTGRLRHAANSAVLLLLVLAIMALLVGWYLLATGERPVDRSAIGMRGLVGWLTAEGVEARYAGGLPIAEGTPALRVLPLLDTDLSFRFERPESDTEFLATGTERDLTVSVLREKARLLPSLVIAPKWTRAMRHSGYAHASLLLPPTQAVAGLRVLVPGIGPLVRPDTPMLGFRASGGSGAPARHAVLYAPQLFAPDLPPGCTPLISPPGGHLLIRCGLATGSAVHLLSDPDLLNNHGLALGENADLATDLMRALADGAPVLIDTTDFVFVRSAPDIRKGREWADLLRFFSYPFVLAWAGLAALTGLTLWRAWVRFGPPRRLFADRMSAARDLSITAKARLLRQAGNEPRLFDTHLRNRVQRIERQLFGLPGRGDPVARISAHVARTDPQLALGFASAARAATTDREDDSTGQLSDALERFEDLAERVVHGSR